MQVVPGTASRDDYIALRDVLDLAEHPGTAHDLPPTELDRYRRLMIDVERSIRADVLTRHAEPEILPAELSPEDGA